ncbi:hypothetical protein [Microvirga tunisiensis]|uniref:DUF3047 domain-containing protein n=1 Tax=Microvirga tunisiensis TaxID=2108360 RepID=A0A5N7MV87_9HYPH|nr:hypothetical protein [Microvirga tunisiensis]MPR12974.1 hypothetical protein [Microvirga tunisiensis]MPR30903.1 hypothetical protein [Microvirga tunisiensis]
MFKTFHRTTALVLASMLGLVVPDLSAVSATTGSLRTWNYALQTDQSGLPNRALAQVRGEEGSSLWFSCTKVAGEEGEPLQVALAATVMQRAYLGPSDAKGRSTVYWFDDRPPEVAHWVYRDRYGQLRGEGEVMGFVASLATAQTLIVELANYRLEPQSVKFALAPDETKTIAERFSKDCRTIATAKD